MCIRDSFSFRPHRNFIQLKNQFLFLHYSLTNFTPDIPMSKYDPTIAEVFFDSRLIDNAIAKISPNRRRNANGNVLRQRVRFSKGSYATLRNLKYFYKTVDGEKSPSNSLIIRRALDLLDTTISSMRDKSSILTEYECLQSLVDPNYRSKRIGCK